MPQARENKTTFHDYYQLAIQLSVTSNKTESYDTGTAASGVSTDHKGGRGTPHAQSSTQWYPRRTGGTQGAHLKSTPSVLEEKFAGARMTTVESHRRLAFTSSFLHPAMRTIRRGSRTCRRYTRHRECTARFVSISDETYLKWAQKYGPVFSVKLGSQRIVVLNSAEAADELLTIRSKWYSNREPSHVGFDLVSDQQRMVHMPYDRESKADEDDAYNDYLIPKGSTVIGNIWAIHMDPFRYPDPTAFKPGRFYHPDGKLDWASGPDTHNRDQQLYIRVGHSFLWQISCRGVDVHRSVSSHLGLRLLRGIGCEDRQSKIT
ncbi:hypothetical protein IEO21_08674 [Rhodonia placenta]|uniref:Cytochrome P450 n=1 Tax=Rhodonia placenta TaxID=104341 RepID=A0A8H7NW05_9APHY|nr:hypothetical protein IEO21_08674 [Postia placenta]